MIPKRLAIIVLALTCSLLAGELVARWVYQIPLHRANATTGYELVPGQKGQFLFSNDWHVNALGMPTAREFEPGDASDILLVGDSIVQGTVAVPQSAQLADTLAARSGWAVWPAAIKSWALQNELAFLRERPQLARNADAIVFVLTSEDFGAPSQWRNPIWHPHDNAYPRLLVIAGRILGAKWASVAPPFPVTERDTLADWAAFNQNAEVPVLAVAYAAAPETGTDCAFVPEAYRQHGEWSCVDAPRDLGADGLRDPSHPSPSGIEALASILQTRIEAALGE